MIGPIVYRLIDAALRFFSMIPSYFKIEILAKRVHSWTMGTKRLREHFYPLLINSLLPEPFFPSNIELQPKVGSHRLPTHRRCACRKFFP